MLEIKTFVFNIYQENTYVLSDESRQCVIIDPGCYSKAEKDLLVSYIEENGLQVQKLLNTHGHIDHMLGNHFVKTHFDVPFETHKIVQQELDSVLAYANMFGLNPDPSPAPDHFLDEGDIVEFGHTQLEVLFTPGHSPGHISFYHRPSQNLISGDVLFMGSIGRVDLPGGNLEILMEMIVQKLLPLGDAVKVHCGHGPGTTLGRERKSNPYILEWLNGGLR